MTEKRRHPRFAPRATIQAINVINGRSLGIVSNLSRGGFMLMCGNNAPGRGEIFQLHLLDPREHELDIEVGATCIWREAASASGSYWCGFQFIDLSDDAAARLERYLDTLIGD